MLKGVNVVFITKYSKDERKRDDYYKLCDRLMVNHATITMIAESSDNLTHHLLCYLDQHEYRDVIVYTSFNAQAACSMRFPYFTVKSYPVDGDVLAHTSIDESDICVLMAPSSPDILVPALNKIVVLRKKPMHFLCETTEADETNCDTLIVPVGFGRTLGRAQCSGESNFHRYIEIIGKNRCAPNIFFDNGGRYVFEEEILNIINV